MINRRFFIKTLGAAGLTTWAPNLIHFQSVAHATESSSDSFFVLIRIPDGWDVTLNMDPQTHKNGSTQVDMFIEYQASEIIKHQNMLLGPALQPLQSHFDDIAIINGVLMNTADNGHDASLSYITTGNGSGKAPSLPIEIANSTSIQSLGVVFSGEIQLVDRKVMVTHTDSVLSLKDLAKLQVLQGFHTQSQRASDFNDSLQSLMKNSKVTDALVEYLNKNEAAINAPAQFTTELSIKAAHIIAGCFSSGASRHAQIDIDTSLDTHSNHEQLHLSNQQQAWQTVSSIFNIFKNIEYAGTGQSLFSRTTFAVVSEFSRTAALNSTKGKDHNPLTNSVLLAGRNINGGQSIGASHLIQRKQSKSGQSQHAALPIDYKTGEIADTRKKAEASNFKYITPDRVIASVATAVGVDANRFKSTSLANGLLPKVFKY